MRCLLAAPRASRAAGAIFSRSSAMPRTTPAGRRTHRGAVPPVPAAEGGRRARAATGSDGELALGAALARPPAFGAAEAEALGLVVVGQQVGLEPQALEVTDPAGLAVVG